MRRLFTRVLARSVRLGALTGVIAGAATAGALIGLGWRHGAALDPFTFAGRAMLGAVRDGVAVLAGFALHVAWTMVWGACFTVVAAPLRGARLVLAGFAFAAALWAVSALALPGVSPVVRVASLSIARTILVYLVLAVSLVAGMRLARSTLDGRMIGHSA